MGEKFHNSGCLAPNFQEGTVLSDPQKKWRVINGVQLNDQIAAEY
jgi:hypothetical protein